MPIVRNKIFSTNTANYTIIDLQQEMTECINILLNMGYEVHIPTHFEINDKLLKSLGRCCRRRGVYHLEANPTFLKVASSQHVHDMIMHECIHCVEGCFNHGAKWKSIAAKVMKKYPQYSITRCTDDEEYNKAYEDSSQYKFEIICEGCGKSNGKYKNCSKSIKSISAHEDRYRCGHCGSKKLVVINLK